LAGTHLLRFASYCWLSLFVRSFLLATSKLPLSSLAQCVLAHFEQRKINIELWQQQNRSWPVQTDKWYKYSVHPNIHRTYPLTTTSTTTSPMENSGLSNILSARGESLETLVGAQ